MNAFVMFVIIWEILYILFIVCLSRPQRRVNNMVKGSVNVAVLHLIGVVIIQSGISIC
jgi:hypothetical protein